MNPSLHTHRAGRAWKRSISRKRRRLRAHFGHLHELFVYGKMLLLLLDTLKVRWCKRVCAPVSKEMLRGNKQKQSKDGDGWRPCYCLDHVLSPLFWVSDRPIALHCLPTKQYFQHFGLIPPPLALHTEAQENIPKIMMFCPICLFHRCRHTVSKIIWKSAEKPSLSQMECRQW